MVEKLICCERHGTKKATFVCQHVAASLASGVPVGFHWSRASEQEFPDAWCSECNARHEHCGWEWVGEAAEHLGRKLLCASCYLDAKRLGSGAGVPAPLLSPLHAAGAWFVILVLAVANGALREAELIPRFGVAAGTTVSGLILVVAIASVTWALLRWRRPRTTAQTWRVGAGWLSATVVFECAFGRFVQQQSWTEILAAYTFENGNLWPLVLLAVLGAPFLLRPRALRRQRTVDPTKCPSR